MASVGPYIRNNVIPAGMSVSEAARQLGVGRPALSNLLNGNAALSRDMALKLERVFGADANMLIRSQAELEDEARGSGTERTRNQGSAALFRVTSTDLDNWAQTIQARTTLPVLVRRLIHATVAARVDFPGYDAGERKGWDGFTEVAQPTTWVPGGKAGWELSVSADLPGKANRDIQARSQLPAAERTETTYVFVTARRWDGKKEWMARQRALGAWRDVIAYDAVDLELWLEQSPLAQIWLMGELGRSTQGIEPISETWRAWSESTTPSLSPKLFDEALAAHRQNLINWLGSDSEQPYVIVGDSAGEALSFVALALQNETGVEDALADRAVLARNPEGLWKVSASSRTAILVVADRATEVAASSLIRRNHVIVVRSRTSVENDPDISLDPPSSEAFGRALEDMGIEEDLRDQLKEESGLSPTILRRRLANTPELRFPEWSSDKSLLRKLMPMLLTGAWSSAVEADRILVEELAGRQFDDVEQDLIDLLAIADTPVWAIGNYRGIVSRKDALFTAGAGLTQQDIDRFFSVAELVLSEDDPALDLPPEERWKANIYDKKREISRALRMAVGELLVLLAVYGARVLGPHLKPVDIRVDALVSKLLRDVEARRWLSQQSDLPLLAEAAPRAFLEAVEADLRSEEPQVLSMLRPVSGLFDSPDRSGLLWALETIGWNPEYLFRVARILARLSEVPIHDNWANKPENSLGSLVRSWFPQTRALIEQRLKVFDVLAREFPAVGWRICNAQVDTGQRFAAHNNRPRWRTDAAGAGTASYQEDYIVRRHALDLMLEWQGIDSGQLRDLIEVSADLTTEDQVRVWTKVQRWIDGGPVDAERALLRESMRRSVLSRRGRKKTRPAKVDKLRLGVFEALAPLDLVERHQWLFAEHWVSESGDDVLDDDFNYRKHEEHVATLRGTAIREIFDSLSLAGVERLLASVNAWGTVGEYLTEMTGPDERPNLIRQILTRLRETGERYWVGCLQGSLFVLDDDERDHILRTLIAGLNDRQAVLELLKWTTFSEQTWDIVADLAPDLEVSYWREIEPRGFRLSDAELNTSIQRLLDVDRPISAFNSVSYEFDRVEGAVLARLMKALIQPVSEGESLMKLDASRIADALMALQANSAASLGELAQLEFLFVNALTHSRHGIPNLEKQIEASPGDFVHLVSLLYTRDDHSKDPPELKLPEGVEGHNSGENIYRALDMLKRTPGTRVDSSVDSKILIDWMVDVRERFRLVGRTNIGDIQIGQLLGRCLAGSDGIWPNEGVRDALEAVGSERILRGMAVGRFNSRGATWRGEGGSQERSLSQQYRAFGQQLQADYPVTARLLEMMAISYDRHADWHDTDEAVRKRLNRR